jgi:putative heme-binding domain-containing protein
MRPIHHSAFIVLPFVAMLLAAAPAATKPLPLRMLVPGFTIRELPVQLTNINSVEYAPGGRLFAVGYDGRIHTLADTDGDGVEDASKVWFAPKANDIRAPVGIAIAPEGLYIPSKGRVTLVKDTDGDGIADASEIVATGWKELFVAVDSVGMAIDKDNNLYFGRGVFDFTNPHQIDKKTGKSNFSLTQETGTVMRISPDRKKREIVATGIRFPVGIAINRHGDLFVTDQEGETWAPGQNPLDELLHVRQGKHYGFPARHETYLPDVIDEPAVATFGPQHQSTCGLRFNEVRPGRKTFGPKLWEDDALVVGESRGKLWRVPLVKTAAGYVGSRPILIASLDMLTIDCAIAPNGDLVVCCHSGPPDWGTGPKGAGRIFKISYTDAAAPQPVHAWASSSREVRVTFDRPVDPSVLSTPKTVDAGEFVRAADRLETLKPPYKVVTEQMLTPTARLDVVAQKLEDDGRTLVLTTAEKLPWRNATYAVAVPGVKAVGSRESATVDVDLMARGVEARFIPSAGGGKPRSVTLPHLDPDVWRHWTKGSAAHDLLREMLNTPGVLMLQTWVDLPAGSVVTLSSNRPMHSIDMGIDVPARQTLTVKVDGTKEVAFGIKDPADLTLTATFTTPQDPTPRPLRVEHLVLPWAANLPASPKHNPTTRPAIGDWARGKELFYGNEAACSKCHAFTHENTTLGPNLANLVHKDPAAVLRDITQPSATINPDYISYRLKLKSGEALVGLVISDGPERLTVIEGVDKRRMLNRADVVSLTPDSISIMPTGFDALGEQKLNDLLTFLTTPPPKK